MIDDHDYEVKMRSMKRFFEEGDKVKVTLRFRGREMAHQELGYQAAQPRQGRHRQDRQGRVRAALRRPPDGHDAGAALSAVRYDARRRSALATVGFCGPRCRRMVCLLRRPLP